MKRYLLFAGATFYPSGGFADFAGDFDTVEEALLKVAGDRGEYFDWHHVVDTETWKYVEGEGRAHSGLMGYVSHKK